MFNIALCDDNTQFLKLLEDTIRRECSLVISEQVAYTVGPSFGSSDAVLEYLKSAPIDVLFLDVDMPKMNGFELAEILCREYRETIIIFMSGYDNFVYDSFAFSPFAYLRKNFITQELPGVLKRLVERLTKQTKHFTLYTKTGTFSFYEKDVVYFESVHNYYTVHCVNGRVYDCRGTLTEAEQIVSKYHFYRIHSAFLINLEYVDRIVDNHVLLVENWGVLPVSQRRISTFRDVFTQFARGCFVT